jgi:putative solute:sodium symporter small subunit|tara:strand:+ start:94 stop:360 length:267 start_codon:yes stop_codon:yes gene_type:complete
MKNRNSNQEYWRANLKIVSVLLLVWFVVSFGFGILWSETLDQIQIRGFKLGFWFAQQGSIYVFVILIFIYVFLMNRLDKKYFESNDRD